MISRRSLRDWFVGLCAIAVGINPEAWPSPAAAAPAPSPAPVEPRDCTASRIVWGGGYAPQWILEDGEHMKIISGPVSVGQIVDCYGSPWRITEIKGGS